MKESNTPTPKLDELKAFIKENLIFFAATKIDIKANKVINSEQEFKRILQSALTEAEERCFDASRKSTTADAGWDRIIEHPLYIEFNDWQQKEGAKI
jgi:hypothetical protein